MSEAGLRVGRNSLVLLSGDLLGRLVGAVFQILLAGYLGRAVFGELSFAFAFAALLGTAADLGLSTLVAREVSRRPAEPWRAVGPALRARALLGTTLALAAVGLTWLTKRPPRVIELVAILAAAQVVTGQGEVLAAAHRGREKMAFPALVALGCRVLLLAAGGVAMLLGAEVRLLAILVLASAAPLALALPRGLPRTEEAEPREPLRRFLSRAAPIGLGALLWAVYFRGDVLLLGWLRGDVEAGLFAAPFRLVEAVLLLQAPLLAALFPLLSRRDEAAEMLFSTTARYLAAGGALAAAFLIVESGEVVSALFGPAFSPSAQVLRILAFVLPLSLAAGPLLTVLVAQDRERRYVAIMLAGALVNPTLDVFLIPHHGAEGAAAATLATEALILLLALQGPSGKRWLGLLAGPHLRALAAGALLAGGLLLMSRLTFPFPLRAAAGIILLAPLAARVTGCIRRGDLRALLRAAGLEDRRQ